MSRTRPTRGEVIAGMFEDWGGFILPVIGFISVGQLAWLNFAAGSFMLGGILAVIAVGWGIGGVVTHYRDVYDDLRREAKRRKRKQRKQQKRFESEQIHLTKPA